MKILFASVAIYPSRGAVAQVTEPLAAHFSTHEMCVVGEQVLGRGRIKRPESSPHFHYLSTNLTLQGRAKRFFVHIRWICLFPWLLFRLNQIFKKENCDYVIGTFPDNFFLLGAYLTAKWNRVGFSSYFHNTYLENRPSGFKRWWAMQIQPRVLAYSDNIFVMSEGMKGYYDKVYPQYRHKIFPLHHTFAKYPDLPVKDLSLRKERYDLVLTGNFSESNLEATRRLINAIKGDPKYRIKMFTPVQKFLLKMRGIDTDAIDYRGYIKQEDFFKELMDNDICILTHGFTGGHSPKEYETIFPTRTIPLLLSGVPIFAHSPSHSFLNTFIKKYDCAELVETADEELIREKLSRLVNDGERKKKLVENALSASAMFFAPNVADFLRERINHDKNEMSKKNPG